MPALRPAFEGNMIQGYESTLVNMSLIPKKNDFVRAYFVAASKLMFIVMLSLIILSPRFLKNLPEP